jgi:hypothetical protein
VARVSALAGEMTQAERERLTTLVFSPVRRRLGQPPSYLMAMKDAFQRRLSCLILEATYRGKRRRSPFHKALLTGKTTHAAWPEEVKARH